MDVSLVGGGEGSGEGSNNTGGEGQTAAAPGSEGGAGDSGASGGEGAAAAAGAEGEEGSPAYTPSLKFKYPDPTSLDKHIQLDGEIDPFFQSLITDADSEKKVKELYEKAYGLDSMKPRYQKQAQELRQVRDDYSGLTRQINDVREDYARGDLDSFFQKLQIPEEKILQWMVEKINYQKLPEDQKRVLDARRTAEQEANFVRKQNESLEERYSQTLVQHRQLALQVSLQAPEVVDYAKSFDAQRKPGAFRQAVCERGELAWARSGGQVDLTPEQAIQEVMAMYGATSSPAQPAGPSVPGQQAGSAQKPTVIPNIGGRGASSPLKTPPKNLDDLRKLANSM